MTMESASGRTRTRTSIAALAVVSGMVAPWLPATTAAAAVSPAAAPASSIAPTGVFAASPEPTPTTIRHEAAVRDLPMGFRPEGITAHGGTLYVSSLADGTVLAVDQRTGHRRPLLAGVAGRSLRGMQVDERTGLLYVTGNQGPAGIVLAVDRRTGHVVKQWTVPGARFLNDLVVTRRAVWVTDSRVDRLTRIPLDRHGRPGRGDVRLLPLEGPWPVPDAAGIRANGIRELPDGRLLLDHSTAGGLWTVDPHSGAVHRVRVTGGPALAGGDGLERKGDRLWVVRGTGQHVIAEYRLDHHHGAVAARWVRDLTNPSLDVPSTAVVSGGRLWAVNARFGVAEPDRAGYWVTGLPLDRPKR